MSGRKLASSSVEDIKYMGSKSKIAKSILPIIQKEIDDNGINTYIEPFCGGCNVIDKINCDIRIASDKQRYLIALFKNLNRLNELPDFITKEHYSEVRECYNKNLNTFDDWYIGAIGFLASYNGRFFDGGYAGLVYTKAGTIRNYYDEAKRNLIEQMPNLKDIRFSCCDYKDYSEDLEECLFYCDPPYQGQKYYGVSKDFNYEEFWDWVRRLSKNNIVLVSEKSAPDDFECIWSAPIKRTIDNTKRVDTVERLFKYRI